MRSPDLLALTFVGSLIALGGCRPDTAAPRTAASGTEAGGTRRRPAQPPKRQLIDVTIGGAGRSAAPALGVPHSGNIDRVALSADGVAALTRDHLGGVRLWPTLDGASQPLVVPVRGVRDMALARRAGGGLTLALIDAAGASHILTVDGAGAMTERGATSPHEPLRQIDVLPGGEHLVVLAEDRSISLLDVRARRLARLQERRFRPAALRVHASGTALVAIRADGGTPWQDLSLRTVRITTGDRPALTLEDGELGVDAGRTDRDQLALSPDGRRLAALVLPFAPSTRNPAGSELQIVVVDLIDGSVNAIPIGLLAHEPATLGFVSSTRLIATSHPSGGSWLVDLAAGGAAPTPIPSPPATDPTRNATATAAGLRVSGDGTWLFVQRPRRGDHHYLGFHPFVPHVASLSPSGQRVAWLAGGAVFLEEADGGGPTIRLIPAPEEAIVRVVLVDDDHVLTVDHAGGIALVRAGDGAIVDRADAGGSVHDFEYSAAGGLLRVARSRGGLALFEVSVDRGFVGPHLALDGSFRSGFGDGGRSLWTLDHHSQLRTYELDELRRGIASADIAERSTKLEGTLPTAIDRRGRFYVNTGPSVQISGGPSGDTTVLSNIHIPGHSVVMHPSPTSERVAVVSAPGHLGVYEITSGQPLVSLAVNGGVGYVDWSEDGERLAATTTAGGIVLDATTGETLHRSCGPRFERRATPPPTTFSGLQQPNLCEQ